MKKSWLAVALFALVSVSAGAQEAVSSAAAVSVTAVKGKMLYATNGGRLGSVYRVAGDGSVQLILDGNMKTVPASTLAMVDGKLTTSLSKAEVISLR
ncbi:MAG: hypothetical protein JWQ90_1155 [Hydrocarboniphaga sp.]|uniref:hypothetical protein n=1 Tax=Hydrocarboniphaga sp. TaxID=2033016 RepID=UPI00262A633E|nr:hypothetical protein [Hydrocarboniphaga sp.]MDB5968705.1 hypothetical protein [Hydrocarboniphaga sp.]